MPSKVIKAKLPNFRKIANDVVQNQEQTARLFHQRELENYVSAFETKIPIELTVTNTKDKATVLVGPNQEATTTNAVNDIIKVADILYWLDKGTNANYAVMPRSFANETVENSLDTRHADYDRRRIFISSHKEDTSGIAPRNFMRIIGELYERTYYRRIRTAFTKGLRNGRN